MADPIFDNFLTTQLEQGTRLASESDIVELLPQYSGERPPNTYVVRYTCVGVLRGNEEPPKLQTGLFYIGIRFPDEYLRRVQPERIVTWLGPTHIFSPHIFPSLVCCGSIEPGTSLVDLIYRIYEIITYSDIVAPNDPLNKQAAEWARRHQNAFPTDRRPLKRPPGPRSKVTKQ